MKAHDATALPHRLKSSKQIEHIQGIVDDRSLAPTTANTETPGSVDNLTPAVTTANTNPTGVTEGSDSESSKTSPGKELRSTYDNLVLPKFPQEFWWITTKLGYRGFIKEVDKLNDSLVTPEQAHAAWHDLIDEKAGPWLAENGSEAKCIKKVQMAKNQVS